MKKCILLFVILVCARGAEVEWVRAGVTYARRAERVNTNAPVWGMRGGLQFALHPAGFSGGDGGPRGLVRIGYPTLSNAQYDLINFIAVEPIVRGRKGFSELEKSSVDGKPGKLMWTGTSSAPKDGLDGGEVRKLQEGVEELVLNVSVERFDNGAHVRLRLSQRSDAPGELRLMVEAVEGSAAIESCILTATMGNKARARLLNLKEGPVSSLQLYPDYKENHFAPHKIFGVERMMRLGNGDVFVSIENDEENPASVQPFGRAHFWDYRGRKVTQYWRKPAAEVSENFVCAVNGRHVYWGSKRPIPGGISFENFELREPFRSGQTFIFGIRPGGGEGRFVEGSR